MKFFSKYFAKNVVNPHPSCLKIKNSNVLKGCASHLRLRCEECGWVFSKKSEWIQLRTERNTMKVLSNSWSRNNPKLTINSWVDHSGDRDKKQCCCRLKHLQASHVLIHLVKRKVHSSPSAIKRSSFFSIAKTLIHKMK